MNLNLSFQFLILGKKNPSQIFIVEGFLNSLL